ncbi:MAG: glycosyltransferase [Cyclobacteriaceae bacterium]
MYKVLIVGQTPPPYYGQAISTQRLLEGSYQNLKLYHVRLSFSKDINQVGKFSLYKIIHLFSIIFQIIYHRLRYTIPTLYYMPVGNNYVPLYRDIVILLCTRWLFKSTVFHFRSAGVASLYLTLSKPLKMLYRKAFYYPDLGIRLSEGTPPDGKSVKAKKNIVVPNGLEDFYLKNEVIPIENKVPIILYVGILMESKGIQTLLETAFLLKNENYKFKMRLVGKPASENYLTGIQRYIKDHNLVEIVELPGARYDDKKWQEFLQTDIFLFPSHFETFGLSVLEAMQFKLPIVASDVGGLPDLVIPNKTGFLAEVKNSKDFASKVAYLLESPALREKMGQAGRDRYLHLFTVEKYWENMENALTHI